MAPKGKGENQMNAENIRDIQWLKEHWDELTPDDMVQITMLYHPTAFAEKTDKCGIRHLVFLPTGRRIY